MVFGTQTSGTNRSKSHLWDQSFQQRPLGQIVVRTTYLELYATRHATYAVGYTLYHTNNLPKWSPNRLKNSIFGYFFAILSWIAFWGRFCIVKQTLGQIVPKNKKRLNKFFPPSPLKKKGAGRAPREAAQFILTQLLARL